MLSFVVDLFHNGQQLSATWSATTDIIQIQGILREEDESDLIWLFFWLCPHLRGYGMNFARWYSSLDLMNILCYNIQDSISLGYSSGSIECEGWRQHSWKRLINNVSEVCLVWYSQPLTSIFCLVNSSIKKMKMSPPSFTLYAWSPPQKLAPAHAHVVRESFNSRRVRLPFNINWSI